MTVAPDPTYRLIPSRYPPVELFDTVATAADLPAVMELAGWTNDRLVVERLRRLPESEWVYGRPNASIVMAAFLHVAPAGSRFNGPDLGAWYAAADLMAAAAEVGHHLRREAVDAGRSGLTRIYRAYTARLAGDYLDITGERVAKPALYAPDSYTASQIFGESVRTSGGDGILYDSVRLPGHINVAAYRPSRIEKVTQADHYEISVQGGEKRIDLKKLKASRK